MKSITEQGSSIERAIKSAWERAQKPKKFVIAIFEEPTYNFLGINTHPAKVGLFFEVEQLIDTSVMHTFTQKNQKNQSPAHRPSEPFLPENTFESKKGNEQQKTPQVIDEQPQKNTGTPVEREIWTQEMIHASQEWLKQVLKCVNLSHHDFTINALHYDLRIVFDKPLLEHVEQQQQLFRSLCLLLLQTLRQKFHRPLRGFRITINSALHDNGK